MSEMTATRIGHRRLIVGAVGLVCAGLWILAAHSLWATTVPHLLLSGFDEHRYFSAREISRAQSFGNGEAALWLLGELATLAALVVLAIRMPRVVRGIGLGRIGSAIVVGMVA